MMEDSDAIVGTMTWEACGKCVHYSPGGGCAVPDDKFSVTLVPEVEGVVCDTFEPGGEGVVCDPLEPANY